MSAEERLLENGYVGVIFLTEYSYDDALIGVTEDGRAVYDYEKMIQRLMDTEGWSCEEAMEWIDYNTLRSLPYRGEGAPIIMYPLEN